MATQIHSSVTQGAAILAFVLAGLGSGLILGRWVRGNAVLASEAPESSQLEPGVSELVDEYVLVRDALDEEIERVTAGLYAAGHYQVLRCDPGVDELSFPEPPPGTFSSHRRLDFASDGPWEIQIVDLAADEYPALAAMRERLDELHARLCGDAAVFAIDHNCPLDSGERSPAGEVERTKR